MTSTIATIPAEPVDPTTGEWPIVDADVWGYAFLGHDFTGGGRIDFLLPRRNPVDFFDHDVVVNVAPDAVVRWRPFKDHVKADVVFNRKPADCSLWFAVALTDLAPVPRNGGVDLEHPTSGSIVGVLPRPFLIDGAGARHDLDWQLDGDELTCQLPDLDPALYVGAVFDPTTIDTSTVANATGYANQRTLVRLADGTLIQCFDAGTDAEFWVSTDNGAGWTNLASNIANWVNGSIAVLDANHIVAAFKESTSNLTYTAVGTVNGGRTAITWTGGNELGFGTTTVNYPSVTGHVEGTGYRAHVVVSDVTSATANWVYWREVVITGALAQSNGAAAVLSADPAVAATNVHTMPSIDVDSSKNLRVAWHDGSTGGANGVHVIRLAYSAGTWTPGTIRNLDTGNAAYQGRISSGFDGTRHVIAYVPSTATTTVEVLERDAGDTATTNHSPPALSDGNVENISVTYDAAGNIYVIASAAASQDLKYVKYTRAAGTWGSWTSLETTTVRPDSVSAKLGSSGSRIEISYTTGASSPYDVRFTSIALNTAPTAPTWVTAAGAKDVAAALVLDDTFNDPDAGDTPSAWALKRDIGGTVRWWDGTDWDATTEQKIVGSITAWTIPVGWGADGDVSHVYYAKHWDASDSESPYSAGLTITPSAKVNPTITSPTDGETVGTAQVTAIGAVAQKTAYRWRVLEAAPSTTQLWSSGKVPVATGDALIRTLGHTFLDGESYQIELVTWNLEDLESDPDVHDIDVVYDGPPAPTFTIDDSDNLKIVIEITNPAPTGSEPALASQSVHRRPVGDTSDGVRRAEGLGEDATFVDNYVGSHETFEFRIEAIGVNNTSTFTAWQS